MILKAISIGFIAAVTTATFICSLGLLLILASYILVALTSFKNKQE